MKNTASPEIRIFPSPEKLYEGAAEFIRGTVTRACLPVGRDCPFTMALSGGSTPAGLFRRMSSNTYRDQFRWNQMHFFWGDERWVPPTDSRSNFRMTQEALLDPAKIPAENIHPVPTSLASPAACAEKYEEELRRFFKGTVPAGLPAGRQGQPPAPASCCPLPVFDLILLGLGEDGHTASLFPGDPACEEKTKWVTVARTNSSEPRITLTFPVLLAAKKILFLVSGKSKRDMVEKILRQKPGSEGFPASRIHSASGKVSWFLDTDAGS